MKNTKLEWDKRTASSDVVRTASSDVMRPSHREFVTAAVIQQVVMTAVSKVSDSIYVSETKNKGLKLLSTVGHTCHSQLHKRQRRLQWNVPLALLVAWTMTRRRKCGLQSTSRTCQWCALILMDSTLWWTHINAWTDYLLSHVTSLIFLTEHFFTDQLFCYLLTVIN